MIPRTLALGLAAVSVAVAEVPVDATRLEMVSTPAVSPDGKTMVFEWIDDLWSASTEGGEAKRIVDAPGRDGYPQFTPDGKRVVFSSDRTGSLQVYSVSTSGAEEKRHTWHTEGCELKLISPDGKQAIIRGMRERAGFRATRLMKIDLERDTREQVLFDATATSAAWSPDGKSILFCRGGEQLYRKGYHGARASRIWRHDLASGKSSMEVQEDGDVRSPFWQDDGKGFYYVSSRKGTPNLWLEREGQPPEAVTRYTGDGVVVRPPSVAGPVIVFHRGFDLIRLRFGEEPVPLELWTREKLADVSVEKKEIRSTTDADFTSGSDQVVFSAGGELWWIKAAGEASARLTRTPEAESGGRFSTDGAWLYFLRDNGVGCAGMRARLRDGKLSEEQTVVTMNQSLDSFRPSPDGGKVAWIAGAGDVFTANADGSDARLVYPCWDRPTFDWSPDGRWLAVAAEDRNANRDIWLVDADGKQAPLNLTRHPAFEGSPRWSPDGKWLAFSARREADGKSRLWRIGFGKDDLTTKPKILRASSKAKKLPTGDIEPTRVIWAADSESVLFQNKRTSDKKLYSLGLSADEPEVIAAKRGVPVRTAANGVLMWRVNQQPAILQAGKETSFPISFQLSRPRKEVLELAFRRVWRTLGERFYDPKMNGNDWEGLRLKYERVAAGSRTSRQFDRVVSQLFGELNASHLSFLRKPWPEEAGARRKEPPTAHPGLVFREDSAEGPLVIRRAIRNSPVAKLKDAPQAGETVARIAGETVTNRTPLHRFFNGAADRPLAVVIRNEGGAERVIELRCISYPKARALDRLERTAAAKKAVRTAGNYRYLRVPDMTRESFDRLELEVYRASLETSGIVLDLRDNGGGREADRMLSLFCQPEHAFTVPRGGPEGYPYARRVHAAWDGPLVVLCNANTFSNAEIFCHAMKATGRAPLVGQATAGGVISAVKATIPDGGELQVPFRGWYLSPSGKNLDLNGATPDHPVEFTPDDEAAEKDPQLAKALEVLKKIPATR
ncbi:MAG: hypothetical protein EOP88_15100 [Verrucomicrobiaceae bacterium]|nr:MAG: hypothetical protein EOP88_15100 [Verrucomicrobiaceae bacterium]